MPSLVPPLAVNALENILDESSSVPAFKCNENGPSETVLRSGAAPPEPPSDASGFELSSEVVNCSRGWRRILLPKIDVADARLDDVEAVAADSSTAGFMSFSVVPLLLVPLVPETPSSRLVFANGLLMLIEDAGRAGVDSLGPSDGSVGASGREREKRFLYVSF